MSDKERIMAWLFDLMAKVQMAGGVSGTRQESGSTVVLRVDLEK